MSIASNQALPSVCKDKACAMTFQGSIQVSLCNFKSNPEIALLPLACLCTGLRASERVHVLVCCRVPVPAAAAQRHPVASRGTVHHQVRSLLLGRSGSAPLTVYSCEREGFARAVVQWRAPAQQRPTALGLLIRSVADGVGCRGHCCCRRCRHCCAIEC